MVNPQRYDAKFYRFPAPAASIYNDPAVLMDDEQLARRANHNQNPMSLTYQKDFSMSLSLATSIVKPPIYQMHILSNIDHIITDGQWLLDQK